MPGDFYHGKIIEHNNEPLLMTVTSKNVNETVLRNRRVGIGEIAEGINMSYRST